MNAPATVYLIPTFLDGEALDTIPPGVLEAIKACQVFFVENERSARRYLKLIWKEIDINRYEWFAIHKSEESLKKEFVERLQRQLSIGIISEAGCPGIADPGQMLVEAAQKCGVPVKPLVGPNSIILALMASGMNGQQFQFNGYLPVSQPERIKKIRELEENSVKQGTQIFIETPYRNNVLLESLLKTCRGSTRLCIAADITGKQEFIKTKTISSWKQEIPDFNKRPVIFLLQASDPGR